MIANLRAYSRFWTHFNEFHLFKIWHNLWKLIKARSRYPTVSHHRTGWYHPQILALHQTSHLTQNYHDLGFDYILLRPNQSSFMSIWYALKEINSKYFKLALFAWFDWLETVSSCPYHDNLNYDLSTIRQASYFIRFICQSKSNNQYKKIAILIKLFKFYQILEQFWT